MPGLIDTPMITTVPEKITKLVVDKIPLRRKGSPEEVAEVPDSKQLDTLKLFEYIHVYIYNLTL